MEREHLALDGLLRELARAPGGDDDAFVERVLAGTRRPAGARHALLAAAGMLLAIGFAWAFAPDAPTGRMAFSRPACLVPDAVRMRVLLGEPATERLLLLGEVPIDAEPRVPAGAPILLQAVGRDGMALWTAPTFTRVRKSPPTPGPALDPRSARSVEFARDVKPILDQHCSGCHAEADLVHSAVKPFGARRSPLVTQSHAPISAAERSQLALWVDLGAPGRP
jgi:hypothetical protein